MASLRRFIYPTIGIAAAVLALGIGLRAARADKSATPPASATPQARDDDSKSDATEAHPAAYPVVTVQPVRRRIIDTVRGFGTVRADARTARTVTNATVGVVTEVLVLPGERVRRGQPLLRTEPDPLAYLAYQQAQSAAKLAGNELRRLSAQRADGLATASQVEAAQKTLADANAAVDAARRQGAAAASSLVASPSDGIVTTVAVAAGERPAIGAALATIATSADRVALGIEPGLQARVHAGDRVTLTPVQGAARPRVGHVARVSAALDPDSRLVLAYVTLDPATGEPYVLGTAVEGAIQTQAIDGYTLPRAAVVKDDDGAAVFEVRDGKAYRVRVNIVADEGARLGVTGELDASRPVVTTGAYELEDGVSVVEQKP